MFVNATIVYMISVTAMFVGANLAFGAFSKRED